MLRKILIDFEFVFQGKVYKEYSVYLGDTTIPKAAKTKDFTPQIACYALKMSGEELGKMIKTPYWDINKNKLELAGFAVIRIQMNFFPPLSKGD